MKQLSPDEVRDKMVKWLEGDVMPGVLAQLMEWLDKDFMPQVHAEAKKMKAAPNKMPHGGLPAQEAPKPENKPRPPKCPPPPHLLQHAKASGSSMPSRQVMSGQDP